MHDFYPNVYGDRGFLCYPDPLEKLPSSEIFNYLDCVASSLSNFVNKQIVRDELNKLPYYGFSYSVLSNYKERPVLNRLRMLYAYFASAYVHGQDGFNGHIPEQIARPLCALSEIVKRPPILSYADYALNNWKRRDTRKGITLDNLRLLQYFQGSRDEAWFILIHVDIEAKAGKLLQSLYNLSEFIYSGKEHNDDLFTSNLASIMDAFIGLNETLARMPEQCSPDVYYKQVRPYIFGFDKVVYDGVNSCSFFAPGPEQSFRGETGAQSSIVPAVLAGLGIKHKNSILTSHLNDMKNYMPVSHRNFIQHLEDTTSVRDYIKGLKGFSGLNLAKMYNEILGELSKFREMHLEYAISYIQKKCDNPNGTGGTIYVKWLSELVNETKSHYLKSE